MIIMSTICEECGSHNIRIIRSSGYETLQCLECGWERDYPIHIAM